MSLRKANKSILVLCLIVFISETASMFLMSRLDIQDKVIEAFVDSSVLFFVMFPLSYFLVFRNWLNIYQRQETCISLIKESEERYRSLTESSQDAIITADSSGLIVAWNNGAEKIFGYSAEEASKMELIKIIPERYRDRHLEKMKYSLKNIGYKTQSGIMEAFGVRKDGSEFPLEITLSVWNTSKGRFCSGIVRDTSARKEAENKITEERARSVAAFKLASLGELSGSIAHEINTPLSVIQATVQLIERKVKQEQIPVNELLSKVEVLKRMTDNITKIVRSMSNYNRDGRKDSFRIEKVEGIFENISTLCAEKVKLKKIDLKFDRSQLADGASLYCRQTQIEQVLVNLLNNAFDVVEDLIGEKWVHVEAKEKNNQIEIAVSDSGSGIPVEIRDKIFQSFFTTKEIGKGTGLGLGISREIMREHGGDLIADFACNHGRFVLTCPSEALLRKAC